MPTFFESPNLHLIHDDVFDGLRSLPEKSVHCVVTSPPYYALRDYSTGSWEGGDPACDHLKINDTRVGVKQTENAGTSRIGYASVCGKCGAKRIDNQLGLEATPDLFIENLVGVFREVRRALRDDGTCWVNIGDSYASSGPKKNGGFDGAHRNPDGTRHHRDVGGDDWFGLPTAGGDIKALDLMGMPWRFALAMQKDGWYLRRDIVWSKLNPMPESVNGWRWERHKVLVKSSSADWRAESETKGYAPTDTAVNHTPGGNTGLRPAEKPTWQDCPGCKDCKPNNGLILRRGSWRPTTAHEYIFMFTKQPGAYADREAVRETNRSGPSDMRKMMEQLPRIGGQTLDSDDPLYAANKDTNIGQKRGVGEPNGRNLRSVWEIDDQGATLAQWLDKRGYGALLDEFYSGDLDSVWQIATQGLKEKHFASYPEALVEPCIKASTSTWGCCAECGAPYAPVIEISDPNNRLGAAYHEDRDDRLTRGFHGVPTADGAPVHEVVDYRATCSHDTARVPCTVLDPFVGSGTTALVARKLGRRAVGIDLSDTYLKIVLKRLHIDTSREALNAALL